MGGCGSRAKNAPAMPSPEEVQKLQKQFDDVKRIQMEVEEAKQEFAAQADDRKRSRQEEDRDRMQQQKRMATQAAEIQRREQELREREEAAAREVEEQRRREEEARNYPLQPYQEAANWQGSINVGLVGNSGVGKSLLNNKIRNVGRQDPSWSPVGVSETTLEPKMYPFPGEPRVRIWDLPGGGTEKFPRETYIRTVGLRYFDAVLVVSAGRFTETEMLLLQELRQYNVPFFAVRTKVDTDIENNEADNGITSMETKRAIADDLRTRGVNNPYLVSARAPALHDFEKLRRDVHATVAANRRD